MGHKIPCKGYNFRENTDYAKLVNNSGEDSDDLYYIIENSHFDIDWVIMDIFDRNEIVPLLVDGIIKRTNYPLESIQLNSKEEVCNFIKDKSNTGYFGLYSIFKNKVEYIWIDALKHKVNGLHDFKNKKIRNYKIDRLLE
jgi:hypothetical protein